MAVIQKFLMILVLYHADGTFTYEKTLVDGGCPPIELVQMNMNVRRDKGEFVDYDGKCFALHFRKAEFQAQRTPTQ
tara:strand:- start:202 stop:429 length:228 start_codon:yes stop_codon:yes gene_type:complete